MRAIGGDMDDMRDLFGSFVEDTPPLFETMRRSAEAGDWPAFRRAAHTAKGVARDFGAVRLAEICARLESDGSAAAADVAAMLDDLDPAFASAKAALESLLNSGELT